MTENECTFCLADGYTYNQHCDTCIARKIENLRSSDSQLSRKLQLSVLIGVGQDRAEIIKTLISNRRDKK